MDELHDRMSLLSMKLEKTMEQTWQALEQKDLELADRVYRGDQDMNDLVRECMQKDLHITLLHDPVAYDWRYLMATMKILSDIERIADHCADICHYLVRLEGLHHELPLLPGLKEMYGVMSSMVSDVLSFYNGQEKVDLDIMKDKDDIVDAAFDNLMEEISRQIAAKPELARDYLSYVLIVKYVERMADHASNIADCIIYRDTSRIIV
jgi:phosphate transport system protein